MRRWLAAAATAADIVSERPGLWLIGGLAWVVTVGWIPLVVGLAPPPSEADLTFLGSGFYSSGAWPWNAVAVVLAVVVVGAAALVLASVAEAALLAALAGRPLHSRPALRAVGVTFVALAPTLVVLLLLAVAIVMVAPTEFTSPGDGGGPALRTLVRLAPYLALAVLAMALGGAFRAAAVRLAQRPRIGMIAALTGAWRWLAAARSAAMLQLAVGFVARIALLVVAALLLRVLWAPIGVRLGVDGFDAVTVALLVGFVGIWLCLVLAGGALHAWGSAMWSLVLGAPVATPAGERLAQERGDEAMTDR